MIRVNTAELQRDVERYVELSSTGAVAIAVSGEDRAMLVSVKEYDRLKRRDREVLGLADFTEADIEAIEKSRAPEGSAAFDHELDD